MTRTRFLCIALGLLVVAFFVVTGVGATRETGASGYASWSDWFRDNPLMGLLTGDELTMQSFASTGSCVAARAFVLASQAPCTVRLRRSSSRLRSADLVLQSGGMLRFDQVSDEDKLKLAPRELRSVGDRISVFVKRADRPPTFRMRCGSPPCRLVIAPD